MNKLYQEEYNYWAKKLFRNAVFKGGSAPAVDYGAINRANAQRQAKLQAERDEQFRVEGISDYIDYMYDNPEQERRRSATGQFFNAISPGKTPNQFLNSYRDNKSITLADIKKDSGKYFDNRTAQASVKEGRIRLGKRADKPNTGGLLGSAEADKKQLLGA
jgi:hypothetical protein